MKIFAALVSSTLILAVFPVFAQQIALVPGKPDCGTTEPDPIQISWDTPCKTGSWIYEPGVGCRIADWHPDPQDKVTWSASCRAALREGMGVAQWTEHGQPIDRFEGTYRNGRREGLGRYSWNGKDRFEGSYAKGLPNGYGAVTVSGVTLSGQWRDGCLRAGDKSVAIGVPLASCDRALAPEYVGETAQLPPDQAMLK